MSMPPQEPQLTEEELRALEAELERIHVDDVILQTVVSLINLGARKAADGHVDQLQIAIEGVRALLPVIEPRHGDKLGPIRDALSQLQLQFARGPQAEGGEAPQPSKEEPPPSAQSSGRLWVPGQ
jgi:hypothetical protein